MDDHPKLKALVGRREKIEFAQTVTRYERGLRGLKIALRDLIVTSQAVFIIGREVSTKGPNKGQVLESIKRRIEIAEISFVSLSSLQDDFIVIHVLNSFDSLLMVPFKTELVTVLKKLREARNSSLKIVFSDT